MTAIGKVIKYYREKQGISRYKLSKDIGISYPTIAKIENGGDTKVSTLVKICDVLDLNILVSKN